jgi:hypothetical protein
MSFSATTVIQGAPNATPMTRRDTLATTHDVRVSIDGINGEFSMQLVFFDAPGGV